ncbi:NAD(P)-dependent alcohol dehydrogenase [Kitasatospora sp. NA04385]|uniref:zinc-dependent alcohol dehydrogenase family protein n=1 Tax=Kitasatospora sp. NA04385 TaxID=2742135 RepID=UPI0015929AE8|nr:NAD(P)-dependent alcohol dehydrogenase [Kitasatospora sp. NA04385]QKW23437.1 NAD(P)-dependent alcohol dehydrogenase [Kitasatospora sp. NA04385]
MRSYHVDSGAGIDGLAVREHPDPAPGPGQALVAVRAASLSFRDLMVLRGDYLLPVKPDVVPVADGAGLVVAVGSGVTAVRVGDRVAGNVFPSWREGPFDLQHLAQLGGSLDGMLTELALLDADSLVPVPAHLSFAEAATLPCAAVTAWNALTGDGEGLRAGQTLLTLGSGGVSLFALQFGKALGARVIATTSSPDKARRLLELGADEVVDYRAVPDWAGRVRELTDGRGADRVVDVAGGLEQSLRAVRVAGHVACVGFVAESAPPLDPRALFRSGATVRAVAVGSRAQFLEVNALVERHRIRPLLDRSFPFDRAVEAFRHYASGAAFGKVTIDVPA